VHLRVYLRLHPRVHPGVLLKYPLSAALSKFDESLCFCLVKRASERPSFNTAFCFVGKMCFLLCWKLLLKVDLSAALSLLAENE
jgi:hypothetical protein